MRKQLGPPRFVLGFRVGAAGYDIALGRSAAPFGVEGLGGMHLGFHGTYSSASGIMMLLRLLRDEILHYLYSWNSQHLELLEVMHQPSTVRQGSFEEISTYFGTF